MSFIITCEWSAFMNSGVFMKALDIFCIYVILNLWIGGYSQQTIHN